MAEQLERAERFLLRAEEVRSIADDAHDKSVKESLLRIAADYEKMAESLIAMHRSNAVLRARLRPDE
ncbi:MAG TPA: hypothetical protein VEU06_00205 [Micropepsaceae bacterium]|nr:hypothetical protein [Micropepsaceae bacterium]